MKTRSLSAVLARLIWLCMAPLLLLTLWFGWGDIRDLESKRLREAGNLARNFATYNDRFLDARIRALNILAISPLVDDPRRWPELYREALGFVESFGTHVIFADEHGQMLFNTRQPYGTALPRLPVAKGRSAVALAIETGKPQVNDIILGPAAGIPLVPIVVPVLRDGKPTRLMLSTLEARQFQARVERHALPVGWSIALRDSAGADIARRSPPGFDSARDVDADHRIVVRSELAPWSVVLEIPRSNQDAEQRRAMYFLAAAILLAVVLGLVGGVLAGRRISRQVALLTERGGSDAPALEIVEVERVRRRLVEADAELEASQRNLQLWGEAFRRAEVGLAISDARSNRFVSVNTAFARQRGYGDDELVGQSVLSAFPVELHEELSKKLSSIDTLGHAAFESEHQRKDGSRFPVLVDLTTLHDASGTPVNRLAFALDITERRQAESALIESEQKYRTLFENMSAGFAVYEVVQDDQGVPVDLVIIAANEGFSRTTGLRAQEVIGQRLTNVLPGIENDAANWIGTFGQVALSGESREFEQSSERLGTHYSIAAYRAAPRQCAVTFHDISARKQGEDALRASEERFRRAVVYSPFPILLHAEDGAIIQVSQSWCDISGYTREELTTIGDWTERAYGERRQLVQADIDRLYGLEQRIAEGDYAIRTKSGDTRIWEFSSAPLGRLPDGRRLVSSMALDVTERHQAGQKLREQVIELQRWQKAMLGREGRVLELKREINRLLVAAGQPARYANAATREMPANTGAGAKPAADPS